MPQLSNGLKLREVSEVYLCFANDDNLLPIMRGDLYSSSYTPGSTFPALFLLFGSVFGSSSSSNVTIRYSTLS